MDSSKMILMMIITNSHFADSEQVIIKINHFADFEQNSLERKRMPRHLIFFECLGIQFFNSSRVTYGTPCRARGHSHSPKEAEDFPRGEKYFRHMPPLTYLIYFSPKGLY